MDRVRFGRALGTGAREAAKALLKAADAATAPNPNPSTSPPRPAAPPVIERPVKQPVKRPAERSIHQTARVKLTAANVKRGGRSFGQAVWTPMARAGGVLWLEVTGVLFGLFALVIGAWVWSHRADLSGVTAARQREWFGVAMFVVFAYFTVSSYVRAVKRSRR